MNSSSQIIEQFAGQIQACIVSADWDSLQQVLQQRQHYLETIFTDPRDLKSADLIDLKSLAQAILAQDAEFQTQIEQQKSLAVLDQKRLDQGRKAIAAYSL